MTGFYVGQEAEAYGCFTMNEVLQFARITGDSNPLHVDETYAGRSRFGGCIVHGILVAGLISKVLGTQLPGEGGIYLEQNLSFRKPVFVGEKVIARVKIKEILPEKNILLLETNVYDQDGQCVILGTAKMLCSNNGEAFSKG